MGPIGARYLTRGERKSQWGVDKTVEKFEFIYIRAGRPSGKCHTFDMRDKMQHFTA